MRRLTWRKQRFDLWLPIISVLKKSRKCERTHLSDLALFAMTMKMNGQKFSVPDLIRKLGMALKSISGPTSALTSKKCSCGCSFPGIVPRPPCISSGGPSSRPIPVPTSSEVLIESGIQGLGGVWKPAERSQRMQPMERGPPSPQQVANTCRPVCRYSHVASTSMLSSASGVSVRN